MNESIAWSLSAAAPWALILVAAPAWGVSRLPPASRWGVFAATMLLICLSGGTFLWPRYAWTPDSVDMTRSQHVDMPSAWYWLNARTMAGWGWSAAPSYLVNATTGTYLGERFVGLLCHISLLWTAAGLAQLTFKSTITAVGTAFLLATSSPILWASRWFMGADVLVLQVVMMAAIYSVFTSKRRTWAAIVAGMVGGLSLTTYAGARMITLYLVSLVLKPRALLVAAPIVLAWAYVPFWVASSTGQPAPDGSWERRLVCVDDGNHMATLNSLWRDRSAGRESAVSLPGTQTMTDSRFLAGAASAVVGGGAWAWVDIGAASLLPDVVGCGHGRSHRQILIHVPWNLGIAALLAQLGKPAAILAVGYLTLDGIQDWIEWTRGGIADRPNFPSLWPCRGDSPPGWCPADRKAERQP